VGATTPLREKTTICNILEYGGVADNSTDVAIAIAITLTFNECVLPNPQSRLYGPPGDYLLQQSIITPSNATNWAVQLDGLITAQYDRNDTANCTIPYLVPRALILEGCAGADALNATVNGEGDGEFLDNLIVIINGGISLTFPYLNGLG
jgi:hypothetical protein